MFGLMIALGGCKVGPDYAPPDIEPPAQWSVTDQPGLTARQAEIAQWWKTLDDPVLDSLIERAVVANHDLRIAQARVREARGLRRATAADRLPQVDAIGSYTRSRSSENAGFTGGAGGGQPGLGQPGGNPSSVGEETDLFQAGFDAAWELDVFGGVARSVEAADADIAAAEQRQGDVLITLLAEVARAYTDLRTFQQRLEIAQRNIQSQSDSLALAQSLFDARIVSELDVAQAKAQLATTQSEIPTLEASIAQSTHALALLLGLHPAALSDELAATQKIPAPTEDIPLGLPSDLLRRRPDVRAAERDVAATTARIGVATADLFPRFSLTGSLGLSSQDAGDLLDAGSRFYSLGPSVRWPILDAGRIRGNIAVQNARQEEALARYEQTILCSFGEVEDALVAFWKQQSRSQSLSAAVDANQRAVELASELYARGLTTFLNVLEAQQSLFEAEDRLAQSDRDFTASAIALYKALGGGWEG